LAANLRADGHAVHEYGSPDELPPLTTLAVAVVVSDYQMPGMDGLTFAKAFHEAHPAVPILLLTACSGVLGCPSDAAFVKVRSKPSEYDELHSLLHELVGNERAQSSASLS
jgi:CheY-like chemotaxis protein